jgi:hypothetical protein
MLGGRPFLYVVDRGKVGPTEKEIVSASSCFHKANSFPSTEGETAPPWKAHFLARPYLLFLFQRSGFSLFFLQVDVGRWAYLGYKNWEFRLPRKELVFSGTPPLIEGRKGLPDF